LPVIRNDLNDNSILNAVSIKGPDAQKLVLAAAKARASGLALPDHEGAVKRMGAARKDSRHAA